MLFKNAIRMIKSYWKQFALIGFLISFLLFFLNILLGLGYNIDNFSQDVRHKLGIYFYIKEGEDPNQTYSRIISLKSELENASLKVEFYSKDDAIALLEKRMPDVIKNFERYGIDNPLPPTLYVIFDNQEKFESLKNIISKYEDLILNIDELGKSNSYIDQETRIKNMINLSNFIVLCTYFLIAVLLIIIISFLLLIIRITFYSFYKQIELEKLLGADYFQIKLPFLANIVFIIISAFLLLGLYSWIFLSYLNFYMIKVFAIDMLSYILYNFGDISLVLIAEILLILGLSFLISNLFLNRLIKKI